MADDHPELVTVFEKFIAAWNEPDAAHRRRLLDETCDPGIEISSPFREYRGVDQQFEEISHFQKQFPRGRCLSRVVSRHHRALLQAWRTEFGEARAPLTGIDCIQFNDAGLIVRVVSFSPVNAPS